MKSKTIILSSPEQNNSSGRGILTIYQEDDLLKSRIRLYNIPKLSKYCKIGIYHNKQVFSANLLEKDNIYTSSMVGDFDLDQDFYSAIVDTQNNNKVLLSGGTYAGYFFNDNSVFENEFNEEQNLVEQENLNTSLNSSCLNNEFNNNCSKCEKCKYKEFFYSQTENKTNKIIEEDLNRTQLEENFANELLTNSTHNNLTDLPNKTTQENPNILQSILPQFKYIFENYEPDESLNKLIPNGKFVRVNEKVSSFSLDNNNQYSIGAIYEENQMKYICYAVLCNYNSPVPEELGPHYQWLPLDKEDPLSEGYYVVFQDAVDLKIVEL